MGRAKPDSGQIWGILTIVTRRFFYKKTFMIKVIQNFMEITLCFNCFSEKTCWKMLFNILFSVSIFDTMFLFWFVGGCCLVAIAWSRIRLQMSTKKKSKLKLEELFSASSFGVCLYIKSDLHKILDNFYLHGFHIEETKSYVNLHHHIAFCHICLFLSPTTTKWEIINTSVYTIFCMNY